MTKKIMLANTAAIILEPLMKPNYKRAIILLYHSIGPEMFERHVSYVKRYFEIVPLDYLLFLKREGESLSNKMVITFDEGWRSNYKLLPILKSQGVPVTIYVPSQYIGTRKEVWPHEIKTIRCLAESGKFQHCNGHNLPDINWLKRVSNDERLAVMAALENSLEYRPPLPTLMSKEMVLEMLKTGLVTLGSHSRTHPILSNMKDSGAWEEIARSKQELETMFGVEVNHFSYPDGKYSQANVDMVIQAGYNSAATTAPGFVHCGSDDYKLNRIQIDSRMNECLVGLYIRMESKNK